MSMEFNSLYSYYYMTLHLDENNVLRFTNRRAIFFRTIFNTACRQDRNSIEQPYVIIFISLETDSFSMHF
jgi:hypothetical protein